MADRPIDEVIAKYEHRIEWMNDPHSQAGSLAILTLRGVIQDLEALKETMPKWISVEDRLPEDDKLKVVRMWDKDLKRHHGINLSRYYLPANQKTKKFWCIEFKGMVRLKVSHYMELPEPPEEK